MNKASKEYSSGVEYLNISNNLNISVVKQFLAIFNHSNNWNTRSTRIEATNRSSFSELFSVLLD